MFCVKYVVKNWYDNMLLTRHDATFDGAFFDSLEEIKEWANKTLSNGRGYIVSVTLLDPNVGEPLKIELNF